MCGKGPLQNSVGGRGPRRSPGQGPTSRGRASRSKAGPEGLRIVGRRDEDGYAMVVSVVVATVAIMLVSAILAQGVHLLDATTRDRRWNNALQVAEAGIERTVVELIRDPNATGMSVTTVPFGQFETTVTTP